MTCFYSTCLCVDLSLVLLNTFVFGVKRETTGYARQYLKMDIRGQSDQVDDFIESCSCNTVEKHNCKLVCVGPGK